MKKIVSMISIATMLCSTIGTSNYELAKAANAPKEYVDVVSDAAIGQKDKTSGKDVDSVDVVSGVAVEQEDKTLEDSVLDEDEIRVGDFILEKCFSGTSGKEAICITKYLGNDSKVVIPNEYKGKKIGKIAGIAFMNNTSLEEVQLPDSLETIADKAFWGCTNLKKIELPETLEVIGDGAFGKCNNLKDIRLPKSLRKVEATSFEETALKEFVMDSENTSFTVVDGVIYNKKCTKLIAVPPHQSKIEMPDTVTEIAYYVARGNKKLKEIKFSNKLKEINASAFEGCTALKEIKLPDTLMDIRTEAFKGCMALKKVIFPKNLECIYEEAFKDCIVLNEVKFSSKVESIGYLAFEGCEQIKKVHIPASVTFLGYNAFAGCKNIKTFEVDSKNKKYSASKGNLFDKKKTVLYASVAKNETLTLPKSVKKLEYYGLFSCNEDIKKVKVEKGNKNFCAYDNALYNKKKTKLYFVPKSKTSITLPATVTDIKDTVFDTLENSKLKDIHVKTGNKVYCSYKGVLYNKKKTMLLVIPSKKKSIVIPKTVTNISELIGKQENIESITIEKGNKTFQVKDGVLYDEKLTEVLFCPKNKKTVTLPESVETIKSYAFNQCDKLENIELSKNLKDIKMYAFKNCTKLKYIKFPEKMKDDTQIAPLAFLNCSGLKWIYVTKNIIFLEEHDYYIFAGCNNLTDIYYVGDEMDWKNCWDYDYSEAYFDWEITTEYSSEIDETKRKLNPTIHYEAKAPL